MEQIIAIFTGRAEGGRIVIEIDEAKLSVTTVSNSLSTVAAIPGMNKYL